MTIAKSTTNYEITKSKWNKILKNMKILQYSTFVLWFYKEEFDHMTQVIKLSIIIFVFERGSGPSQFDLYAIHTYQFYYTYTMPIRTTVK